MMRFTKAVSLAAVAVCSVVGMASAASVDVFYKFSTEYGLNCEFSVDCQDFERGVFELRLSYENVSIEKYPEQPGYDLMTYIASYGGETKAKFKTPIGPISFQATGTGGAVMDFYNEGGASVFPGESLSSILEPQTNYFNITGVSPYSEGQMLLKGRKRVFSFSNDGDQDGPYGRDTPVWFRLENKAGEFISGDGQAIPSSLEISISEDPLPSPVPLPASAPLLLAGLGLLGFRARRKA